MKSGKRKKRKRNKPRNVKGKGRILCESNKVLVVGIHVGEFAFVEQNNLLFAQLLAFANLRRDDTLHLFAESRVPVHLFE